MGHKCQISKVGRLNGHRVSHAKNRTKHVFMANIQSKSIYIPQLKKAVRVKISTRMLRTIDRLGVEAALLKHGLTVKDLLSGASAAV